MVSTHDWGSWNPGSNPGAPILSVRIMKSPNQENQHSKALVAMWADYIDWEKRRSGEDGFLIKMLKRHKCREVFNSGLGDGCDTIYLLKEGFDVVSNEIDDVFLQKALENAKRDNVAIELTNLDWRDLTSDITQESFDAVICLGNSLTYLFKKEDQLKALIEFRKILRPGGVLIIDERNYQYMLDHKKEILKGKFRNRRKFVYCGDNVDLMPVELSQNIIVFEYTHKTTGEKARLTLYPFKENELLGLLEEAGFSQITQYSDFKKGANPDADFFTYVCVK